MILIFAIFSSFLAGALFAAVATCLYCNEFSKLHKADAIEAIAKQAQDSWYVGYMRSQRDLAAERKHEKDNEIKTELIAIN